MAPAISEEVQRKPDGGGTLSKPTGLAALEFDSARVARGESSWDGLAFEWRGLVSSGAFIVDLPDLVSTHTHTHTHTHTRTRTRTRTKTHPNLPSRCPTHPRTHAP